GVSFFVNISAKAFDPQPPKETPAAQKQVETTDDSPANADIAPKPQEEKKSGPVSVGFGPNRGISFAPPAHDMRSRVKTTILESMIQIIWMPLHIIVLSFSS